MVIDLYVTLLFTTTATAWYSRRVYLVGERNEEIGVSTNQCPTSALFHDRRRKGKALRNVADSVPQGNYYTTAISLIHTYI